MTRPGLVIGGTGMLAGCSAELAADGWDLLLPSRRRPPGPLAGTWVPADWSEPAAFARLIGDVLAEHGSGPLELVVAWVHSPYREPVLRAVGGLLAPGAPVVEVVGSAAANPASRLPPPVPDAHPAHQVLLGFRRSAGRSRWLTDEEISRGVYGAVVAALDGEPPRTHEVGQLRPWSQRP